MKVISGKYKNRVLDGFDIDGTRPTMDRIKESLFAMIQFDIKDKTILDLFSGSGNLGIEALSNGSKYAYLCDSNKKAINIINNNIKKLDISNVSILHDDFKNILKNIDKNIDIIFLDPPYKTNYIVESIELITKYNILNTDGLIICESDNLDKIIYDKKIYKEIKNKKYGDKFIVILKKI